MHATQLIQLLKILNPQELKAFQSHLKSINSDNYKAIQPLFSYLKKYAPDYDSPKLYKIKVMAHLAKKQPINEQKINKLAYDLKSALQDFLVQYDLENNPLLKEQLVLRALEKRNHPNYAKESKKLIQSTEAALADDLATNHFLTLFQLHYALWSDINTEKINTELTSFQAANNHLDTFYFLRKLKIILEYYTLKDIRKTSFELLQTKAIIDFVQNHPLLKNNATIQIFISAIKMLDINKQEQYFQLKNDLFENVQQISKKDARDILLCLNNYNTKLLSSTPDFSTTESFQLFHFAEAHQLLMENNRIRDIEYVNATLLALSNNNISWALSFIEKYKPFLSPEKSDITYTYTKAACNFHQKKFDTVTNQLKPFDQNDLIALGLTIQIKTLNIRAFFERWVQNDFSPPEEEILLLHLTQSFERYMTGRKQLSPEKQSPYLQFIYILNQLIKFVNLENPTIHKLKKIQGQLKKGTSIAFRKWLIDKIEEMKMNLPKIING